MRGWTYLLLNPQGEVYVGATGNLKQRLKTHNSKRNKGWTRGRHWHLLAVKAFETRKEAFTFEAKIKRSPQEKILWKLQCLDRACKLVERHGYTFCPKDWANARWLKKLPLPS